MSYGSYSYKQYNTILPACHHVQSCPLVRQQYGSGETMIRAAYYSTLTVKGISSLLLLKWGHFDLSAATHPITKPTKPQSGSRSNSFNQSYPTSPTAVSVRPLPSRGSCPKLHFYTCSHVHPITSTHHGRPSAVIVQFVASSAFSSPHSKEKTSQSSIHHPNSPPSPHHRTTSISNSQAVDSRC